MEEEIKKIVEICEILTIKNILEYLELKDE